MDDVAEDRPKQTEEDENSHEEDEKKAEEAATQCPDVMQSSLEKNEWTILEKEELDKVSLSKCQYLIHICNCVLPLEYFDLREEIFEI